MMYGVMLALAGVIVLITAAAQAAQNSAYAACSEAVTATVTKKRKRNVKRGIACELNISYTVNGTSYEKTVGSTVTEYEGIREGDKIELKYKPDNPQKSVRPKDLNPKNAKILLLIGIVLIAAGAVMFFIGRR